MSTAELKTARLLTMEEVLTTKGAGWIENWFAADEDEPESFELSEVAWCYGTLAHADGDGTPSEFVEKQYLKKYGMRIWTEKPTEEQRKAVEWE